ncbi:hypothetical protein Tco_0121811 [Tanacetum coccineum]
MPKNTTKPHKDSNPSNKDDKDKEANITNNEAEPTWPDEVYKMQKEEEKQNIVFENQSNSHYSAPHENDGIAGTSSPSKPPGFGGIQFQSSKLSQDTYFWEDLWHGDMVLKQRYPRLYALEVKKTVDVASKLSQENLTWSFRRAPRSGVEQDQLTDLTTCVEGVVLGVTPDRILEVLL